MNKLLSWLLGVGIGALFATALVVLFAPVSGPELRRNLRDGYTETMAEARRAQQQRKAELDAELSTLRAGWQKR